MGESKGAYKDLVMKPDRKRPLRILRRRWENNIKMDYQKIILWLVLDLCGSR